MGEVPRRRLALMSSQCSFERSQSPGNNWRAQRNIIKASRLYLITNAHMILVEQRHILYSHINKDTTFCFGVLRIPEAIVIALLANEQTMAHLQEQFRVLECELGRMEEDYLADLYQPNEIIPLKKKR